MEHLAGPKLDAGFGTARHQLFSGQRRTRAIGKSATGDGATSGENRHQRLCSDHAVSFDGFTAMRQLDMFLA